MSDLLSVQPGADDSAPAAPIEPVVDAPVVPAAPIDPVSEDGKLNEAEQAEADEWDLAADEMFPGLKKTEEKKDESTKPEEKPKENEQDKGTQEEVKSKEELDKSPEAAGEEAQGDSEEDEEIEPSDASARLTAREQAAEVEVLKSDIREKMFADVVTELKDADGDPIKSIGDLMKIINPNTGENFTEEQAGMYLLQANQQIKDNLANIDKQVNEIAETQSDLKDQADIINYKYGELLKAMPEKRAELWAEYEKTLVKDPKSGIIIKAPVSLQKIYETALEPYAELGRTLVQQEANTNDAQVKADAEAKAAAEAKKTQVRQDRSDIYGKGKTDTMTDEDKEWGAAAEAVFGKLN